MDDGDGAVSTAGVVLLFRPDLETAENVMLLAEQVGQVYLVNNSPGDASIAKMLALLPGGLAMTVLDQSENRGVAAGFNAGMRAAFADGYDQVVIFDQDTTVTPGLVRTLTDARSAAGVRAGIVGPALRSAASGVVYRRESGTGARRVDTLISSGSLFHRDIVAQIGLHDEPLFIDYVDHDICLRAKRAGLHNLKVYDALVDHRFGDSHPTRLLGRRVFLANYSPTRLFYSSRNRVIVIRRYGFGAWFWADAWFTAKAWIKLLLLEQHRGTKIRAGLRGIRAGLVFPARERRW